MLCGVFVTFAWGVYICVPLLLRAAPSLGSRALTVLYVAFYAGFLVSRVPCRDEEWWPGLCADAVP